MSNDRGTEALPFSALSVVFIYMPTQFLLYITKQMHLPQIMVIKTKFHYYVVVKIPRLIKLEQTFVSTDMTPL